MLSWKFGLAEHFPFLSLYTRRRQLNGRDYAIERVMRNKFDILSDCVKLGKCIGRYTHSCPDPCAAPRRMLIAQLWQFVSRVLTTNPVNGKMESARKELDGKTFILQCYKPFIMLSNRLNHFCNFSSTFSVDFPWIFQLACIAQLTCHCVPFWSNLCTHFLIFSLFLKAMKCKALRQCRRAAISYAPNSSDLRVNQRAI